LRDTFQNGGILISHAPICLKRRSGKELGLVKEYDNKIPEVLLGDPVRLHQIILNPREQCREFTLKGKITVSVSLLNEDEKKSYRSNLL